MTDTGIQIFIDGVEVVCSNEITIKEEMLSTSSVVLDNCYPKSWETNKDYSSQFYYPPDYSKCIILKNNTLIFAGVVKNTGDISLNPREPKYASIEVLDFKTLLSEGLDLDFVIADKTITEAIQEVVDAVAGYGFVVGNIVLDDTTTKIGAYSTLDKTPYDVLQYLAEISQARWFTRVVNSSQVAIDFYSPNSMPRANDIKYTSDYFDTNNIIDMSFSFGTRDYRNKQAILSNQVYGSLPKSETLVTNGYDTTYNSSQTIGVLTNVSVNGTSMSIGTNTEKTLGIYADFYYTPNSTEITSNATYTAGTEIMITYTPLIKGRQVVTNNAEVSRINTQINRTGVISRYETRNDILSSDELAKVAQNYIQFKGSAEIILNVETKNKDLFKIGDQVYFSIPSFTQLQTDYMVKEKETNIVQAGDYYNVFYTYKLSSNYNSDMAINYFDNQRRKANGNINGSDFITRNIDINNTANIIFYGLTSTSIAVTGDNILDSVLDSPFID